MSELSKMYDNILVNGDLHRVEVRRMPKMTHTTADDTFFLFPESIEPERHQIDLNNIKGHIQVAKTDPMFTVSNDDASNYASYELQQKMGAHVDDCVADEIYKLIMARWGTEPKPLVKMECHNCGGVLEMDYNKHIFHCPYCNAVYAVGVNHINSR